LVAARAWCRRIVCRERSALIDHDAFTAFEVSGWDAKAAGYDDFFGRITSRLVEPLLDAVDAHAGVRMLDVATGPGYAAAQGADRGASVVGIDIAEAMVVLASRIHPHLDFRVGNAEALPFPDDSFDAVVGNFVMLHLSRPDKAAAEFVRVLCPGGRLALTVWDVPEKTRLFGLFLDAIAEAGATPPRRSRSDRHSFGSPTTRSSLDSSVTSNSMPSLSKRSCSRVRSPHRRPSGKDCSRAQSGPQRSYSVNPRRYNAGFTPHSRG
jgi:SAM-dependent methyltransferase